MNIALKHAFPLAAALALPPLAGAEPVTVTWDAAGRYSEVLQIAAGKSIEVCEKLDQGARVGWDYTAAVGLDFNVHYHEGKDVRFAARQKQAAAAQGLLQADSAQHYCWMWTNPSATPATLTLALRRL